MEMRPVNNSAHFYWVFHWSQLVNTFVISVGIFKKIPRQKQAHTLLRVQRFYNTLWEIVKRQFEHFPSSPVLLQSQINIPVQMSTYSYRCYLQ
jgi:hypothetical protein